MAIGSKYSCTVGDVEVKYNKEVRELISELVHTTAKVYTYYQLLVVILSLIYIFL